MPNYTKARRAAKKKRNVLFISSEVFPFTSGSDLADITNGLPLALEEVGNEMRIMMPKYGSINDRIYRIHDVIRLKELSIPLGKKTKLLDAKVTALPASKTQTYFLYNDEYFKRKGIYSDPNTEKQFRDNDERFVFFSRGVFETLKVLGWKPDIIHGNGWIAGLAIAYLKLVYKNDSFFENVKSVFTLYDIDERGVFSKRALQYSGLSEHSKLLLKQDKFDFLRLGISYADVVTTLSPTYAKEILTPKVGKRFASFLKKKKPIGILNGINSFSWNPKRDRSIKKTFTEDTVMDAKLENKAFLYTKYNIDVDKERPLIIFASELKERAGVDLLIKVMPALVKKDVAIIVAGGGDKKYVKFFTNLKKKYGYMFKYVQIMNEEDKRHIFAATDIILMPSIIEPCGVNHIRAMRYGAVAILRETGGMIDVVKKIGKNASYTFKGASSASFLKQINLVLDVYENKKMWAKSVKTVMSIDWSWADSAKKYDSIYDGLFNDTSKKRN